MQEMATKIVPVPGTEPGTYKFKATFGMAGRWQLSLGAKVQGETGTVENKLVITAAVMKRQSSWPAPPPPSIGRGGAGVALAGVSLAASRSFALDATSRRQTRGGWRADLLSGSGRQAVLFADADQDRRTGATIAPSRRCRYQFR